MLVSLDSFFLSNVQGGQEERPKFAIKRSITLKRNVGFSPNFVCKYISIRSTNSVIWIDRITGWPEKTV